MEDAPTKSRLEEKPNQTASSRYSELLGLGGDHFPKSTEELPPTISLPPEILGDLEEAILLISKDGRERSQFIDWDSKKGIFMPGNLYLGIENATSPTATTMGISKTYWGKKAILEFHTHPEGNFLFSEHDLIGNLAYPRKAFIRAVGASQGISFLFQTAESSQLPISTTFEIFKVSKELKNIDSSSLRRIANYFDQKGYKYYIWTPSGREYLIRGDLKQNITIRQVPL